MIPSQKNNKGKKFQGKGCEAGLYIVWNKAPEGYRNIISWAGGGSGGGNQRLYTLESL